MSLIVSVDPGTASGVCVWDTEQKKIVLTEQMTVEQVYEYFDGVCDQLEHTQIEKFTITSATVRKAREQDPTDVIGYLRYVAWRCGNTLSYTKPADVMRAFPDAVLRRTGLYPTGKPHAADALRHLLHVLVRNGEMDPRRFLPGA